MKMLRIPSVALKLCAWAALGVYAFWTFVFCLPTWTWEWRGDVPGWEKWRMKNTLRYRMVEESSYLLYGFDLQAVLLWWFALLVAAFCTYMAAAAATGSSTDAEASKASSWACKLTAPFKKMRHFLASPTPGQEFWLYWCEGLNYAEVLGVLAWITMHCVGFWDFMRYYSKPVPAYDRIGIRNHLPVSVIRLEWISYTFAWLAFIDLAFLFLPIAHNSFLNLLTGLSYSALVRYHRWIGHSTMWMVWLHGIFFYFYWICDPSVNFWHEFFDWGKNYYINVFAGTLAGAFGGVLWITSLNWCRRKYFEVYYKAHIIGFIGFVFFAMLHYAWMWSVLVPGLVLYFVDVVTRLVQSQFITTAQGVHTTADGQVAVVDLVASKEFSKCPVQELFLQFPSISRWQWHPFTIMNRQDSKDGATTTLTVAFKAYGSWTQKAIRMLASHVPVPIRVTGAMAGTTVEELQDYNSIVMVSGGIGATPLIALLQEIIAAKARNDPAVKKLQHVKFIWTARNTVELTVIPGDIIAAASSEKWLELELYHTGSSMPAKTSKQFQQIVKDVQEVELSDSATPSSSPSFATSADGMVKCSSASAFFWNTCRVVQQKSWGPLYTALVTVVAFTGAFLGLLVVQPLHLEWAHSYDSPDRYYKYGLGMAISITVQSIGLPMILVVLPVNMFSYFRSSTSKALPTGPAHLDMAVVQDNGSRLCFDEHGLNTPITSGRPDLKAILELTAAMVQKPEAESAAATHVGVFCAGPAALIKASALLVQDLNRSMAAGEPILHFHKHAFEL